MDMIGSRNHTSHTYDDATTTEIYDKIVAEYHTAFNVFRAIMEKLRLKEQG